MEPDYCSDDQCGGGEYRTMVLDERECKEGGQIQRVFTRMERECIC